jgi:hypothetical protein
VNARPRPRHYPGVMATRSIVTSHPDIACDVCGRRLLRGEQPDVFLAGGQRRMVCELCVPRAAHEGWRREAEDQTAGPDTSATRRSRSLLGRLRQLREHERDAGQHERDAEHAPHVPSIGEDGEEGLYDFLDSQLAAHTPVAPPPAAHTPVAAVAHSPALAADVTAAGEVSDLQQQAVERFNASEHPRRVGGVMRSLGAPSVNVAPAADDYGLVDVVVAWELCWYRYRVDPAETHAAVVVQAEGTELHELPPEHRAANATADERGELALTA